MVDKTDVVGLTRESGELVASKVVVVVDHCIGEATDDGLGDIYNPKKSVRHVGLVEGYWAHLCSLAG